MSRVRYTDPLPVPALGVSLFDALWETNKGSAWWHGLLCQRREALVVVALDASGVCSWAVVERTGLVGTFTIEARRRSGLGSRCLSAAVDAARARWPGIYVYAQPRDRGGAAFFRANGLELVKAKGRAA